MYCTKKNVIDPTIYLELHVHVALTNDFIERKNILNDLLKGKQSGNENQIQSWGDDSGVKVLAIEPEELNSNFGTHTIELKDL